MLKKKGSRIMSRSETALNFFNNEYNCSQSVLAAFSESLGIDTDMALRIASPFGAGVARQGEVCGAVSGALMAIGLYFGKDRNSDPKAKERCYEKSTIFMQAFAQTTGSCSCSDLLETEPGQPVNWAEAAASGKFKTHCPVFVETAVLILEEILKGAVSQQETP